MKKKFYQSTFVQYKKNLINLFPLHRMKKKINKRKEKKSTEAKKLKLDISEFDSKPDLIALGLAAKPDSAPVGSDLGLIAQPDLIAVGLAVKPDPSAFGTKHTKDNAP